MNVHKLVVTWILIDLKVPTILSLIWWTFHQYMTQISWISLIVELFVSMHMIKYVGFFLFDEL